MGVAALFPLGFPRVQRAGHTNYMDEFSTSRDTGARTLTPDPVVEEYKKHIDRTLLRANLRRSLAERLANLVSLQRFAEEVRRAGRATRGAR